jgi:polysaccharide biosynthesis protein PslH
MKKVIVVSTDFPDPTGKGYQVVLYHRLKELKKNDYYISLKLVTFKSKKINLPIDLIDDLEEYTPSFLDLFYMLYLVFFRRVPLQVAFFTRLKLIKTLHQQSQVNEYKFIYSILIRTLENSRSALHPIYLEAVDSATLNFSRRLKIAEWYLKPLIWVEGYLLKHYESSLDWVSGCAVVSEKDAKYFQKLKPIVLPIGISHDSSLKVELDGFPRFLFSGNMYYEPNIRAVNWIIEELYPSILTIYPEAKLYIVGRGGEEQFVSQPGVVITGEVPNMASYIKGCDVSLAPMLSGSGMQFKILEALAYGKPVVVNELGLGVIRAKCGREVFCFNSLDGFISAISSAIDSGPDLINERKIFIEKHHSWTVISNTFINDLEEAIEKKLKLINL